MKFHTVVIIFNPNSTGDGKSNANQLQERLQRDAPDIKIIVKPTEYAGHALELASEYANDEGTVIISSSGDGGYNEVINGVINNGNKAATAVLPSGNANDHYNATSSDDLIRNIIKGISRNIEAIQVTSRLDGKEWTRFAHSYVGFGITPKIGKELTIRKLNAFNEKWHTIYHLMRFKHIDMNKDKTVRRYSSLVFSTISRMSKIIRLEESADQQDGKMEVYETEYQTPFQLMRTLLMASVTGLSKSERVTDYRLKTIGKTMIQLDGEVFTLDGESDITLTCHKAGIRTVL